MENPRVRQVTAYYEEDGVDAANTIKGFAENLLAKSTNRWRKIKVRIRRTSACKVDQQMAKKKGEDL